MITKADIKQETNSVSYNRGKKIYEEQKVHAFQVQEMEDIFGYQLHKITAVVDGSGKNMYCVSVSVDEEMSEIMEDDCDCPAHEQYWGLCKHCVAVLLYYLEWRKKERKKLEEKVRNGEGPALTGDGTKENPYDIASAMTKQDNSEAWVMGYIVGNITDKDIKTESVFEPPFVNAANILIAAAADETDYKKCIPVQLVGGTDVRAALNLKDNEGNLGKAVVIKGQLTKYFGVAGLKSPTAAVLDG